MKFIQKTWNEFWGEFLLVSFHKDTPDKWKAAEKKALWVWENAHLKQGSKVLDLGCGSGLLDNCLASSGARVTAVDRIEPVLEIARKETVNLPVEFCAGDLRKISYPDDSFDCILILETAGLMSREDDTILLAKSSKILKKGGVLIIDCPDPEQAGKNYFEKKTSEGLLKLETSYEPDNFIQTIIPILETDDSIIELYDPYDTGKNSKGVKRYLYPKAELKKIMEGAGFAVREIPHYWGEKYYSLLGEKN